MIASAYRGEFACADESRNYTAEVLTQCEKMRLEAG
jgi:hypothetical protein